MSASELAAINNSSAPQADLLNLPDILQFPLIAAENSRKTLNAGILTGENIYFGTGVVTPKAVSQGLPFDFLGMLLTAEWVRRKTGAQGIIHEISDSHALTNPLHSTDEVRAAVKKQKEQAQKLVSTLGLDDYYRCVLASEYRASNTFEKIQAEVDALCPGVRPYVRYQSAGNLYFARYEQVRCKIGWLVDDDDSQTGLDERSFNRAYDALNILPLSFTYTWSGWNFDACRSRVSPYVSLHDEKRLMLYSDRPAIDELRALSSNCANDKIVCHTTLHLARIVSAYDILFGKSDDSLWSDAPGTESAGLIPVLKSEPWIKGKYIDAQALARRIDEIRSMKNQMYGISLSGAAQDYMAHRQKNAI